MAGLANVDITPELAARLAMAYGTTLKKDSTVITSRDSSRSARMLKRAMMAGLNAVGVNVLDLEVASVPVTRFAIRRPEVAGGLTIRLVEGDPQSCVIRFFDADGSDLTEDGQRKIERLFVREDFRRAFPAEIGDIGFPPRALEHYTAALEATVDIAAIRERPLQGGGRLLLRLDVLRDAERAGQARRRRARGQPVRRPRSGPSPSTRRPTRRTWRALVLASGAHLGAVIDPDGEHLTLIDDTGHVLTDDQALLALLRLVSSRLLGDTVALPVTVTSARRGHRRGARRARAPHQAGQLGAHGRGVRAGRRASRPAPTAASSSRASCPRSTPRPRW